MLKKTIAILTAAVSAKDCYEAVGTFDLGKGEIKNSMLVCFPKGTKNGVQGTGKGSYNDGSKMGQEFTITQAFLIQDYGLNIWAKEKVGLTTNLCTLMCEFDENGICNGYFSC